MNGTAATTMGHLSAAPAVQEGLYTPERHLFYLTMETFIYQYRKSIGMLNAYAEPFYLPMEENQQTEEIKEDISDKIIDKENNTNIQNEITSKIKTPVINKENTTIKEENKDIEDEWIQVKRKERTRVEREAIKQAYTKNVQNSYAVVKEDEEVVDEENDDKKVPVSKKSVEEKRKTYNVSDITVNEMVGHINEYKENNNRDNALGEKTNKKRNTNTYNKTSSNQSSKIKEEKEENIIVYSDSDSEEESEYDESIIDDDDSMIEDDDSVGSLKIEDLNEEEQLYAKRMKEAVESTVDGEGTKTNGTVVIRDYDSEKTNNQMNRIRYQNNVLLFRLEEAEATEKRLNNELRALKEESSKKVAVLESALKKKTELLLNVLRNKG